MTAMFNWQLSIEVWNIGIHFYYVCDEREQYGFTFSIAKGGRHYNVIYTAN